MIDSHCHLDHEPMYNDLKNIILRSKEAGIKKILSICTTKNSFKKIIEIIQFDSIIYGTYGIHPHETDIDKVSKKEIIENVASNKKIRDRLNLLSKEENFETIFLPINLCSDNAAMIALVGLEKFKKNQFDNLDFPAKPRWQLDEDAIFLKGAGVKI